MRDIFYVIIGLVVGSALFAALIPLRETTLGGAPNGIAATQGTSTVVTVGTTPTIPIAATSSCAARIITTGASAVAISFNGIPPTGGPGGGVAQAASTTAAYDCGIYGGGAVQVYSYASQSLRITETR